MKNTVKLSSTLSGVAGEYFVAAELSRRGYIASITLRNTRGIDILAANEKAAKSVGLQIKTNQDRKKEWVLNQKAEDGDAKNLFYVFVNLNDLAMLPSYHIVPSQIVAEYCRRTHSEWLALPGKKGNEHRDNPMRKFADYQNAYLDRWDFLALD